MRLDHLLSMENRRPITQSVRTVSYSEIVPVERTGPRQISEDYERGATRFVRIDLVVQFSMIDETIIETVKATLKWGCSSAGRAPALQAGGHGFDSHHLHQPAEPAAKTRGTTQETWSPSHDGKREEGEGERARRKGDSNQCP